VRGLASVIKGRSFDANRRFLAATGSAFDHLGEFERHAVDIAALDAERTAAALAARLERGALAL
jgi:hypothetical protein